MRTVKEVLELVRDTIEKENSSELEHPGICFYVIMFDKKDKITTSEEEKTRDYIWNNRPFKLFRNLRKHDLYWKKYKKKPRIKWLNKHIEKLS